MMVFLARWARRLSWRETAQVFPDQLGGGVSLGGMVCASGAWPTGTCRGWSLWAWTRFIGATVCEADNFLTVIYQIDTYCRRLLWVGKRRSQATLRRG
jgi:transposase